MAEQVLLSQDDILARYRVSRTTLYRWRQAGNFPQPIPAPGILRWRKVDLDAWDASGQRERLDPGEGARTITLSAGESTAACEITRLAVDCGLPPSTPASIVGREASERIRRLDRIEQAIKGPERR